MTTEQELALREDMMKLIEACLWEDTYIAQYGASPNGIELDDNMDDNFDAMTKAVTKTGNTAYFGDCMANTIKVKDIYAEKTEVIVELYDTYNKDRVWVSLDELNYWNIRKILKQML
jgi:hypothetical protein